MFFLGRCHNVSIMDVGLKTDIHSHILPGVDDGSPCVDASLEMLSALSGNGVRDVFLTPHISSFYPNRTDSLIDVYDSLVSKAEGIDIRLHLCAENMMDEFFESEKLLTYDGKHVLVEMSYMEKTASVKDIVFSLVSEGYIPVLAHPERYVYYQSLDREAIDDLDTLHYMGCEFQLNFLSLSGVYGRGSRKMIKYLFEQGYYSYLGTDIHSISQFKMMNKIRLCSRMVDKVAELASNNNTLL